MGLEGSPDPQSQDQESQALPTETARSPNNSILYMGKVRLRDVGRFAQGHTDGKKQSHFLNPDLLTPCPITVS